MFCAVWSDVLGAKLLFCGSLNWFARSKSACVRGRRTANVCLFVVACKDLMSKQFRGDRSVGQGQDDWRRLAREYELPDDHAEYLWHAVLAETGRKSLGEHRIVEDALVVYEDHLRTIVAQQVDCLHWSPEQLVRSLARSIAPGKRTRVAATYGDGNRWAKGASGCAVGKRTRIDRMAGEMAVSDYFPGMEEVGEMIAGMPGLSAGVPLSRPGQALANARRYGNRASLPFREVLERMFRRTFREIEVLTGPGAERASRGIDAKAFSVGNTVVLPPSPTLGLVAHEIGHVLQQNGSRVDPWQVERLTEPNSREEGNADAMAAAAMRGAPIPAAQSTPMGMVARAQSEPDFAGGQQSVESGDSVASGDVEQRLQKLGMDSKLQPKLIAYVLEAIERKPGLAAALEQGQRGKRTLIAAGRSLWAVRVGNPWVFLFELAQELGDKNATMKLRQVYAENRFDEGVDGNAKKERFVAQLKAAVCDAHNPHLLAPTLYNHLDESVLTGIGRRPEFLRLGPKIAIPPGHPLLYRTVGMDSFWEYNVPDGKHDYLKADLLQLLDSGKDQVGVLANTGTINAFDYWYYQCATDPSERASAHALLNPESLLGSGTGTTWWSYRGVEMQDIKPPELAAHRAFESSIQLNALEPEWYGQGAVRLAIQTDKLQSSMSKPGGQSFASRRRLMGYWHRSISRIP